MSDPFRDQLITELEGYLGHKLFAPEGMHELDVKAILDTFHEIDAEFKKEIGGLY